MQVHPQELSLQNLSLCYEEAVDNYDPTNSLLACCELAFTSLRRARSRFDKKKRDGLLAEKKRRRETNKERRRTRRNKKEKRKEKRQNDDRRKEGKDMGRGRAQARRTFHLEPERKKKNSVTTCMDSSLGRIESKSSCIFVIVYESKYNFLGLVLNLRLYLKNNLQLIKKVLIDE